MFIDFKDKYSKQSDKEIVDKVMAPPHNEEGAIYLIYNRYEPLCNSISSRIFNSTGRVDELQSELYMKLKGKEGDWRVLRSFCWQCTFGGWLKMIAYRLSLNLRRRLIENDGKNVSLYIDSGKTDGKKAQELEIPVDEESLMERRYRLVLLQEAIGRLGNPDQRFVVTQRLHGYSSKEVAIMLQDEWNRHGTVHYNNRHEEVRLDSGNIDNLFKRGYQKITEIFKTLDKR